MFLGVPWPPHLWGLEAGLFPSVWLWVLPRLVVVVVRMVLVEVLVEAHVLGPVLCPSWADLDVRNMDAPYYPRDAAVPDCPASGNLGALLNALLVVPG